MSFLGALVLGQWAVPVLAAPPLPDSTWVALAPLPERVQGPIFAIATSPGDSTTVLVGTSTGAIYRSVDAGSSWTAVARGVGRGVLTIQFSPFRAGLVYAGSRGDGLWRSSDGGLTWAHQPGLSNPSVRTIGFAKSMTVAGGEGGLQATRDGLTWTPFSRLSPVSLTAVAVPASSDPPRFLTGGDASRGAESIPLFVSPDAGTTWNAVRSLGSSTMVATAAAGPPLARTETRPLVVGTNAGAFLSNDGGTSWVQLGGGLPGVDFSAAAFTSTHPERFYLASDGGGTEAGGLWATNDSGQNFRNLLSPIGSITALSVSGDEQPTLYTATMRPADHAVMLWAFRDTGGRPAGPTGGVPAVAAPGAPQAPHPTVSLDWHRVLTGPEAPFVGLGALSLLILFAALVMHLARGRN